MTDHGGRHHLGVGQESGEPAVQGRLVSEVCKSGRLELFLSKPMPSTYLTTSCKYRDQVKALGARWDPDAMK